METKDSKKSLAILETWNTNNSTGRYHVNIYCKDVITNIQLKPHSNIYPKTIERVSKGFPAKAW